MGSSRGRARSARPTRRSPWTSSRWIRGTAASPSVANRRRSWASSRLAAGRATAGAVNECSLRRRRRARAIRLSACRPGIRVRPWTSRCRGLPAGTRQRRVGPGPSGRKNRQLSMLHRIFSPCSTARTIWSPSSAASRLSTTPVSRVRSRTRLIRPSEVSRRASPSSLSSSWEVRVSRGRRMPSSEAMRSTCSSTPAQRLSTWGGVRVKYCSAAATLSGSVAPVWASRSVRLMIRVSGRPWATSSTGWWW